MAYEEYPKVLHHPNHRAAVMVRDPNPVNLGGGKMLDGGTIPFAGTPEQFAPVTIPAGRNAKDVEEFYKAQGYVDRSDPSAAQRAASGTPFGEPQQYPRMLYHDTEQAIVVDTEAAEAAAIGFGYRRTPDKRAAEPAVKSYLDRPAGEQKAALLVPPGGKVATPPPEGEMLVPMSQVEAMIAKAVRAALGGGKAIAKEKAVTKPRPKAKRKVSAATRKKLSAAAKARHAAAQGE